jgi:hypothetical protein
MVDVGLEVSSIVEELIALEKRTRGKKLSLEPRFRRF